MESTRGTPSGADLSVTQELIEAGELLGVPLVDSIVIGDGIYVSLRESGLVRWDRDGS